MTKGLFTSSEEIKFQKNYMKPVAHPSIKKEEKFKPLFSSLEEISFQYNYVKGGVVPPKNQILSRDSKKVRSSGPKVCLCARKRNRVLRDLCAKKRNRELCES
ncbi:MAG: hypothetical protein J6T55_03065 [Alphaproteobacteria bacterium]|nr:hypothetical protein [Alphaproteobacteria bacterium]